ncbi:hypothetical protein Avbf_15778, partial [Armadillidium vulgare]
IFQPSYELKKDSGPPNRYKVVFSVRPSSSGKLSCEVSNGIDVGLASISCFGLKEKIMSSKNYTRNCFWDDLRLSDVIIPKEVANLMKCDTKLSSGRCLNITNISLRKDWFFECIAKLAPRTSSRRYLSGSTYTVILFNFIVFPQ